MSSRPPEAIAEHMHPGLLVMLESTTYPGTTDELVLPKLETSGPEKWGRISSSAFPRSALIPVTQTSTLPTFPRLSEASPRPAPNSALSSISNRSETVVPVSSTRVAEMVKLLENTFRMINIGLVNELAMMCGRMNIDVWEVIDAAATKPFGFMPFYPGPGLGGHCIPIDPFYLSWKSKEAGIEARFIELAGHINGRMPEVVAEKNSERAQLSQQIGARIPYSHPRSRLQTQYR